MTVVRSQPTRSASPVTVVAGQASGRMQHFCHMAATCVETAQIYLHADLALKEKVLARIAPWCDWVYGPVIRSH